MERKGTENEKNEPSEKGRRVPAAPTATIAFSLSQSIMLYCTAVSLALPTLRPAPPPQHALLVNSMISANGDLMPALLGALLGYLVDLRPVSFGKRVGFRIPRVRHASDALWVRHCGRSAQLVAMRPEMMTDTVVAGGAGRGPSPRSGTLFSHATLSSGQFALLVVPWTLL